MGFFLSSVASISSLTVVDAAACGATPFRISSKRRRRVPQETTQASGSLGAMASSAFDTSGGLKRVCLVSISNSPRNFIWKRVTKRKSLDKCNLQVKQTGPHCVCVGTHTHIYIYFMQTHRDCYILVLFHLRWLQIDARFISCLTLSMCWSRS